MIRNFFSNWDKKLLAVFVRFPVSIVIALAYAVLVAWSIHSQAYELSDNLIAFFVTGFFLSVATTLALERQIRQLLAYLLVTLTALLWLLFWLLHPSRFEGEWLFFLSAMVMAAFVPALFFGSYVGKNKELPFWNFTLNTIGKGIVSVVFAGVLLGGFSLAFAAVNILFKAHLNNDVYRYLAVVCFIVFLPVYFLNNLPEGSEKEDQSIRFHRFLKILSLHIILPILLVYTVILYVYLLKILVHWQLPNGWVSWLVSVLGVVGFLTTVLIHPVYLKKENRLAILFSRFFPVLMLPLLVLMTIGILRRFNDYGLTINRILVIILNVWMYGVVIWLLITRSKGIRMIFISFSVVAFFAAVGPWSVFSITRHSVTNRLETAFAQSGMLKNGKLNLISGDVLKPDSVTYENMSSALYYLNRTFGATSVQPFFADTLTEGLFWDKMKVFAARYGTPKNSSDDDLFAPADTPFATENFRSIMHISVNKGDSVVAPDHSVIVTLSGPQLNVRFSSQKIIAIPLADKMREYRELKHSDKLGNTNATVVRGSNFKLVLFSVDCRFGEKITINTLNGVLLY